MNNTIIVIGILIVLAIIFVLYLINKKTKTKSKYVKSDVDNRKYLVQDYNDNAAAAEMLSVVYFRIFELRDYLKNNIDKYPKYKKYIQQFCNRINNVILRENTTNSKYTSYTVNKGQEIYLCLRSKHTKQLHDINLVMYVTIHELAHVACPEIEHTELFTNIFIFLLDVSEKIDIYEDIDFKENPIEYYGMKIKENVS